MFIVFKGLKTSGSLEGFLIEEIQEYLKELKECKTEENYVRFIHASIRSELNSHVHQALEMIRANINSNEGNKSELYYQLQIGLYRIRDGGLAVDVTCGRLSKSKLIKHVAIACGLAVSFTCTMTVSWEKLEEIAGAIKKAGELGESIEKMTVTYKDSFLTDGNKVGFGTSSVVAGIVGAAFLIGLKKSSSG
ncbi:kinase-like domain-containing protein [Tanacetum coccineum]